MLIPVKRCDVKVSKHKNATLMTNENYLVATYFARILGCVIFRW
jgi:hypothetical protein